MLTATKVETEATPDGMIILTVEHKGKTIQRTYKKITATKVETEATPEEIENGMEWLKDILALYNSCK